MAKLYNSLGRQIQEIIPIKDNQIGLYTCGPTVYWYAHIGNLRTYVFQDILKRVLEYDGFKVKHVMNITDVGHLTSDADQGEDKLEKGAARENKTVWEIAQFYTDAFLKDIDRLNIIRPDILVKATDTIQEQIDLIKELEAKGFTYQIADGIYFDTSKLPSYGALWPNKMELKAGARVEMAEGKKNATDFALWKFSPQDSKRQMEWESPWGIGFPGWHTECVVMAGMHLGIPFDIHCGGIDHVLIHHTNEIAQSEAAYGKIPANFWMHGEFMMIDPLGSISLKNNSHICPHCGYENILKSKNDYILENDADGILLMVECQNPECRKKFSGMIKISKSKGNIILIDNIIAKGINPLAFRYLCLTTHYRQKMNFSWEALEGASNALKSIYEKIQEYQKAGIADLSSQAQEFKQKFNDIVNEDLNMPQTIALVWDLLKSDLSDSDKYSLLLDFDKILGLDFAKIQGTAQTTQEMFDAMMDEEDKNTYLEYKKAKLEKNYTKSDELRKKLIEKGFTVRDRKDGAVDLTKGF